MLRVYPCSEDRIRSITDSKGSKDIGTNVERAFSLLTFLFKLRYPQVIVQKGRIGTIHYMATLIQIPQKDFPGIITYVPGPSFKIVDTDLFK